MNQPFLGAPVTQGFGCTGLDVEPSYGDCPHYHRGVDYGAVAGTPVYAPVAGTVHAGWDGTGYGNLVTLRLDNGYALLFGHLDNIEASDGARVSAGALLGHSGSTGGKSTGPHVHYGGETPDGTPIDPGAVPLDGGSGSTAAGGAVTRVREVVTGMSSRQKWVLGGAAALGLYWLMGD